MRENYAELKLYFAFVTDSSFGVGEGRFDREPSNERSLMIVNQAKELIERYLQPGWEWGLHYGWGKDYVATHEQEALFLISHAETHLKNASGLVVPFDRIHGSTRFHRVIRFEGATKIQEEEIVSVMKQSGHLPYSRDEFRRTFRTNDEMMKNSYKKMISNGEQLLNFIDLRNIGSNLRCCVAKFKINSLPLKGVSLFLVLWHNLHFLKQILYNLQDH